jgi:PAS domain S-box-containing protein
LKAYKDGKSYGRLWHHTDITGSKKVEEALLEAYGRTAAIVESIADAFYSLDDHWRFVAVNPAAQRAPFGQLASELLGKVIWDVFPTIVGTCIHQHYLDAVEKSSREHYEAQSPLNGRWYEVFMFPRARGLDVYLRDIDDRKKAQEAMRESEERLHVITNHTPDHILMQDRELRYQLVINPQLGLTEADMLGKTDHDILEKEDAERLTAIKRKVLETGDPVPVETSVRNLSGETEFFEGVYVPKLGPTGQTDGLIGYFRNITERKVAEDQLAKQAAQLQERTARLEEINKELESFSYSVSHDLRTSLRAIDGFSQMLMKKYGDKIGEDAARLIHLIRGNTKIMGDLINDLLSFSRVQKTGMSIAVIDMDNLVKEVWNEIRAANKERELELRVTKMLPGYGDPVLIRQVLVNLISNAVKFTKDRKPGIVEISSSGEPDHIVYCFQDNGVGFDMAYYNKLFGVFQCLHSHEEYEGTGVGLAIVQRIINRHGDGSGPREK